MKLKFGCIRAALATWLCLSCHGFTIRLQNTHHTGLFMSDVTKSNKKVIANEISKSEESNNNEALLMSSAAKWHRDRRREMTRRHGEQIKKLQRETSWKITLPILALSNFGLAWLSVLSAHMSLWQCIALAWSVGSVFSLWQLQILHEAVHGSMFGLQSRLRRKLNRFVLFWGSVPSAFGYWLYLAHGHVSHHHSVGAYSLNDTFASPSMDLRDGDVLFTNHRMHLKGQAGPIINIGNEPRVLSIGTQAFRLWKPGKYIRNSLIFSLSFLLERLMLQINDVVVAITGRNYFFPNKPPAFNKQCTTYARTSILIKCFLCYLAGFSLTPVLFLTLSETLWSLPPHPSCAMFVTNHGSTMTDSDDGQQQCLPTSSTYSGAWYDIYTLGTNYHTEHHDFPTVPLHKLHKLRNIAGRDFYRMNSDDNIFQIMKRAFSFPDFYACTNDLQSIPQLGSVDRADS